MKNIFIALTLFFIVSCGSGDVQKSDKTVFVSIAPLAYLVEQIADSSVTVQILVPETTSPETYEPTTSQIKALAGTKLYINTGLIDFERELNKSIGKISDSINVLDLSIGITVLEGTCSHDDHHGHSHAHGVDPHTWLSPRLMRGFAQKIKDELDAVYPANRKIHEERLVVLLQRIDSLDSYISSRELRNFAIAHPSLTYYAADYGAEQIAIEIEGKEPSVFQMKEIIGHLKDEEVKKIFYQKQTSSAAAETIAREIGAEVIEFDPLAKDWITNLRNITDQIAR